MPTVLMLEDAKGCNDGFTVVKYFEGAEYNLSDNLARNFVEDQGVAKYTAYVEKKIEAAPENKMMEEEPENKKPLGLGIQDDNPPPYDPPDEEREETKPAKKKTRRKKKK